MLWGDWVPPRAAAPPAVARGRGREGSRGCAGGRQKPRRSKGANGSPDLHGEEQHHGGGGRTPSEGTRGRRGRGREGMGRRSGSGCTRPQWAGRRPRAGAAGGPARRLPRWRMARPRHAMPLPRGARLSLRPFRGGCPGTVPPLPPPEQHWDHSAHALAPHAGAGASLGGRVSLRPLPQRSPLPSPGCLGGRGCSQRSAREVDGRTSRSPPALGVGGCPACFRDGHKAKVSWQECTVRPRMVLGAPSSTSLGPSGGGICILDFLHPGHMSLSARPPCASSAGCAGTLQGHRGSKRPRRPTCPAE